MNRLSDWRETLFVFAYFLLLAILVPQAQKRHLGTDGMFFCIAGGAVVIFLLYLLYRMIRNRMQRSGVTGRELGGYLSGHVLAEMADTYDNDWLGRTSLVAVNTQDLTPLSLPQTQALLPYEQEALHLVDETDEEDPSATTPLPEVIQEDNPLYLSDTFMPDVTTLLGSMVLLVGMRRSGKSNLLAVLSEELAQYQVPQVIFDTESEYTGLADRRYLKRAVLAGSPDQICEQLERRVFVPLTVEGGFAFGQTILDGCLQVIIDLKSYSDEDAALLMCEVIAGMNAWQEERPNHRRIPVMVMLDEASKWLPQNLADSYVARETQTELHHAFFDVVVARGGKRGFGLVAATQRYSQINKNLLQSLWKFLFRQTEDVDLARYQRLGIPREEFKVLYPGECFIFSPTLLGFKALIRKRHTRHLGHTPGLENLIAHTRHALPLEVAMNRSFVSSTVVAGTVVGTNTQCNIDGNLEQLPYTDEVPETPIPTKSAEPVTPDSGTAQGTPARLTKRQRLAYELYTQGKTGVVELSQAMTQDGRLGNVSTSSAYNLLIQLESMGLITRRKKAAS